MEVKANITSKAINEAKEVVESIKEVEKSDSAINKARKYYLFGFYTERNIEKLRKIEAFDGVFVLLKKRRIKAVTKFEPVKGEIKSFLETLDKASLGGYLGKRE
jgi:hypothetical protein